MFEHVPGYAGDPIFHLNEMFHKDPRQQKVNLTIGLYYDDDGQIPVLNTVQRAEQQLAASTRPRAYLPIEGDHAYRQRVQAMVFGENHPVVKQGRVATIQSVGGTGALKVGGEFLHDAYPDSQLWMSDPAWENHHDIFRGCGIPTHSYPYYDPTTRALDFNRMVASIRSLPPKSIVLLHACCHNPTGVDPTPEQWQTLITVMKEGDLIPFFDMAYQGFGSGMDEDAFAVRAAADAGLSFLVANSFSKNLSLYSERCGGLSVVCATAEEADRVLGQLMAVVRRTYSTPPSHGGVVTARVLSDPDLYRDWQGEVAEMRNRILQMRARVHSLLAQRVPDYDASHFVNQVGMFSYTGFSTQVIQRLRNDHGVYVLDSGRISVPGLNSRNVEYFCDAVAASLR
ncbi:MAG TPA: amino acid aminotransferase [Burkholderiaceae bacterium]|nr:amino acid aminotransferase [Burkholderiaceae bacterium]